MKELAKNENRKPGISTEITITFIESEEEKNERRKRRHTIKKITKAQIIIILLGILSFALLFIIPFNPDNTWPHTICALLFFLCLSISLWMAFITNPLCEIENRENKNS